MSDVAWDLRNLRRLNGATLHWWYFVLGHRRAGFLASNLPRGSAQIRIVGVVYFDLPPVMTGVRLDVPSDDQIQALRQMVPTHMMDSIQRENTLAIHCEQGDFYVCAPVITVYWRKEPYSAFLKDTPPKTGL